jgi:hypothetical protein
MAAGLTLPACAQRPRQRSGLVARTEGLVALRRASVALVILRRGIGRERRPAANELRVLVFTAALLFVHVSITSARKPGYLPCPYRTGTAAVVTSLWSLHHSWRLAPLSTWPGLLPVSTMGLKVA